MAPKTTWQPAHWLGSRRWLLKDNSVVETPPIETTSSHRRVRLAGDTKSVAQSELETLLSDAVDRVALERGTAPWFILPEDLSETLQHHSSAAPGYAARPDFTVNQTMFGSSRNHTDIVFEFQSVECPALTAMVWVYLRKQNATSVDVRSGITYRNLHQDNSGYSWWSTGGDWPTPFRYYDQSDLAVTALAWLKDHDPIPGVKFINEMFLTEREASTATLKLLRQLVDVTELSTPAWRNPYVPETMKYAATGRTTFTKSLYREMLDMVQTQATVERIQQNMRSIAEDLSQLGIVSTPGGLRNNSVRHAVEQAVGTDLVCHMLPVTDDEEEDTPGEITIVPDLNHTVSMDLRSGSLIVSCTKDDGDTLDRWNFERTKAELTGELDAFLGFARQAAAKRTRKRVAKIVEKRSPVEDDLEIGKFSTL